MDWKRVFDFNGRAARREWWMIFTTCVVLFVAAARAAVSISAVVPRLFVIGGFFVIIVPVGIANFAVGLRRLHDRGKGIAWLVPFYLLPAPLFSEGRMPDDPFALLFKLAAYALSIWAVIELGIRPSVAEPTMIEG